MKAASLADGTLRLLPSGVRGPVARAAIRVSPPAKRSSVAGRMMRGLGPSDHVPILSGPMTGMRWIANSHLHTCVLGAYEPETQETLVELVRKGSTVWDVGACCGYLSMLASKLTGGAGQVVAIEANPAAVGYLRRHVELNGLENVSVVNRAVSDRAGTMQFETRDYIGFCRLSPEGDHTTQTVTLDELLGEYPCPDVLKIDVEGAECAALAGAGRLLGSRPVVLLSTHGRGNYEHCRAVLAGLGYRLSERFLTVGRRFDHLAELLALPGP